MKNVFRLFVIGSVFLSGSCQKEAVVERPLEEVEFVKVSNYKLDQIPLIENTQDVNELMKSDDKDGEKLNKYLYEIGLATREFIMDANFNRIIIEMAEKSQTQTAYLLDLEEVAPAYFRAINNNLAKNGLSLQEISDDMTHAPINPNPEFPQTCKVEKYEPGIFIPNLKYLDKTKQPIISPNVEVDCSKDPSIEDNIVSWYYSAEGELEEIILSEETSLNTSNPLFLINHSWRPKSGSFAMPSSEEQHVEESDERVITQFNSEEISIKPGYRHEEGINVKSEFCYIGARAYTGGPSYFIFSSQYIKIKEIRPDDLGDIFIEPRLHSPVFTPYANNKVYWNTFERDWNRGIQDLGTVLNIFGGNVYLPGNMRYAGDWYAWIPETVNVHATPFEWFGWEESVRFESWKSIYEVHKIE